MKNDILSEGTVFRRKKNAFAIFQTDRYIQKHVIVIGNINKIDEKDYSLVYEREVLDEIKDIDLFLENIFVEFNLHRPEYYIGRSLSISDVVVIKQNGIILSYICNEFGFRKIENFINEDQPNMKLDSKWIFSKKKNKFVKIIQAGNLKLVDGLDIDKLEEALTIQLENFINKEKSTMKKNNTRHYYSFK